MNFSCRYPNTLEPCAVNRKTITLHRNTRCSAGLLQRARLKRAASALLRFCYGIESVLAPSTSLVHPLYNRCTSLIRPLYSIGDFRSTAAGPEGGTSFANSQVVP